MAVKTHITDGRTAISKEAIQIARSTCELIIELANQKMLVLQVEVWIERSVHIAGHAVKKEIHAYAEVVAVLGSGIGWHEAGRESRSIEGRDLAERIDV